MGEVVRLATEAEQRNIPEADASKREEEETAKSAEEKARTAKRELKNARKRGKRAEPVTGPAGARVPAPVNADAHAPEDHRIRLQMHMRLPRCFQSLPLGICNSCRCGP